MMGTIVGVTSPDKRAAGIAFAEINRIEGLLSKYKEDSEVSRLNKLGKSVVSPETFYIIKKSKEFWQLSNGAFDVTVAPLVDLWGFTNRNFTVPADEKIKNILNLVGSDKILLHNNENVIEFKFSGMKIDLGAIAKGYALDCAVKKLKEKGINSCLINAGGQVYCLGKKFGLPWRVAIRDPRGKGVVSFLELADQSVATSGDYEQYFIKNNKRYAHILDPKTGYPADSGVIAVTVIAPDGLTSDALATAIFVLGKVKGEALAKKLPGLKVIIRDGSQAKAEPSPTKGTVRD
jgi:thiamine biosynthesis lipoprotein